MRNLDLRNVVKLTEEDMSANREEKLGPQQRKKLQRVRLNLLGVCVITCAMWLFLAIVTWLVNQFNRPPNTFGLIIYLAVAVIYAVIFVSDWISIRADLKSGKVEFVEGSVTRQFFMYPLSLLALLRYGVIAVQGISLSVPRNVHARIMFGKRYRVYYAPRSRILLAIERLV